MPEVIPIPAREPGKPSKLTLREVQDAFAPLAEEYGPILFLEQAAKLSGYTRATLKKKLSEGCFRNAVARGKPLRFWRDRFVLELMNKPTLRSNRGAMSPNNINDPSEKRGDREAA